MAFASCTLGQLKDESEDTKDRCRALEDECADLRTELKSAKAANHFLAEEAKGLAERCESLHATLEEEQVGSEACCALQQDLQVAQGENAALKDALARERGQFEALRGRIDEVAQPANDEDRGRLKAKVCDLEDQLGKTMQEFATHKEIEAASAARIAALEEDLERTSEELQHFREHVDSQVSV